MMLGNSERADQSISAVLEFNQRGRLKGIYLNSQTKRDELVLWKGLYELIRPGLFQRLLEMVKRET